ncbi:tetratricopeptide repeat protein [Tahibacter amnicola]|uniref:Tetratricopeptide repeat protein n=1 Tax=Tahibacter amnicola TaxID=2976241 RepID=A0ABY6BEC6_9GAMM|nr:hypothetical protein [Tahibacter amnicola]UXI66971.1 hypothetical protein N4264_19785 [Tahibacter amnicola]
MQNQPIQPFWDRIPETFKYPMHPTVLYPLIVLSVANLLTLLPGKIGRMFWFLIIAGIYKIAFEILRATADGHMEPTEGGLDVPDSSGRYAIGMQVVLIGICVAAFVFGGPWIGLFTTLVVVFAMPGIAMSYAMDENFVHAINPATWLQIMARAPGGYFAAFGVMLGIFFASNVLQGYLMAFLPILLLVPVLFFVSNYALFAVFHLMGYLIYQYHEDFGYEPKRPEPLLRRANTDPDQAILDEAGQQESEGRPEAAVEILRDHIRARGGTDAVHQNYRRLIRAKGDQAELLRHGKEWLAIQLAQDREKGAVELVRELMELSPDFTPADAESTTRLARRAAALGHSQLALRLLNGYGKRFPKSADIPENYLLAAKILSERLGKDAEARALLTQLKRAYPEHPLAPEIDKMLGLLDSIAARAPAKA